MRLRSRITTIVGISTVGLAAFILMPVVASANATPLASKDCVLDATTGAEQCFGNYRDAIAFATHGAVTDAPMLAHDAATDHGFRSKVAALSPTGVTTTSVDPGASVAAADNSVIGATLFTGTNYTGDSTTVRIPKPCVKDGKYDYGFTLGTVGQSAESVQPWANCWIWLHSGSTWDSPRQGPFKEDTPDLGDWKNRAVLMGLS